MAYKDSPYLEACLQSIVKQGVESRVIITTSTRSKYIEKIANKYNIEVYDSPGGSIGKDWNYAFGKAKTKYITLAHQDDIYLLNYTEEYLKKMTSQTMMVFGDYREIDDKGKVRKLNTNMIIKKLIWWKYYVTGIVGIDDSFKKILTAFGNMVSCPTVMYNKQMLDGFTFREDLKFTLDWEAWIRWAEMRGSIGFVKKVAVFHRIHGDSETTKQSSDSNRIMEERKMFEKYWPKKFAALLMNMYHYNVRSNIIGNGGK